MLTAEQKAEIRHLWENTPQTAPQIGAAYGVTKSVIVGMAHRAGWVSFNLSYRPPDPEPKTLHDRIDALNAVMDGVLAECAKVPRHIRNAPDA